MKKQTAVALYICGTTTPPSPKTVLDRELIFLRIREETQFSDPKGLEPACNQCIVILNSTGKISKLD